MTQPFDGDLECWRPPQFTYQILYSRLVLEQIRLAVDDAYFLVPRGGLEIGGVLLGKHRNRQVEILDHELLECEHAFGPSFLLSPRDQERLKDLLAKVRHKSNGLEPVGWYHSHTRSEICLTESDLDIHSRYFPELWHVALVMRPSTSQPTRAGFFFREPGGSIRASASYQEFRLEPFRSGPTLLKPEPDGRPQRNNGESKSVEPVIGLPRPETRPQPASERIALPAAPAASSRAQMRPAPEPPDRSLMAGAPAKTPRQEPAPLTSTPERYAPSTERTPPLDVGPARVVRAVRIASPVAAPPPRPEPVAAPVRVPQPKPEPEAAPIAVSPPLPKRQVVEAPATLSLPESAVPPGPVRRVDPAPQVELPRFLRNEPAPKAEWTRIPLFIAVILCLAIALGGFAFAARDAVLHSLRAFVGRASRSKASSPPPRVGPAMSINAIDNLGQLQIRWDTSLPSIQGARSGVLSIVDGGPPQRIPLDAPQVRAGTFTYKRNGARVDARLSIMTAEGSSIEAGTTFLGPAPVEEAEPVPSDASPTALARQNAQLRRQLDEQIARNKVLQAQLGRLRKQRAKKTGQ